MSDKIIIAGRLNVKGWHNKACEILDVGGYALAYIASRTIFFKRYW